MADRIGERRDAGHPVGEIAAASRAEFFTLIANQQSAVRRG